MSKKQGSLKYVLIFVVAIVLIRIDVIIGLGEKAWMMVNSEKSQNNSNDLGDSPVIVRSDKNVELTPRQKYIGFLDSFRVSPELVYREEAMTLFRAHPQMFTEKLDKDLEARIYSWRDLVVSNEPEVPSFLLDLFNILRGENKNIIPGFFSVVLDLNPEMFMTSYPRTKDTTCAPVTMIESAVPPEEKFPELYERMGLIEDYLKKENLAADKKLYATICFNTLKIYLEKEAPPLPPAGEAGTEESSEPLPTANETPAGTTP
ncbi:MAG: hypothetical protein V4598_12110 [Bdellovibrionota bacterium]